MKPKKRMPRVTLGGVSWILLLGFLAYQISPQVKAALGTGGGGSLAPSFELLTLDGEVVSLESLEGKVVLVNFWATWCPPCRVEMPGFQRVYEVKRDEGFEIVAISTDRAGEGVVRDFLEERSLTFPAAMASASVVRDFGGVRALPTSFLVDREGRIRQEVKGLFSEPALRMAVNRLLEETASQPSGTEGRR